MKYAYKIIDADGNLSCYQYEDEKSALSIKMLKDYTYIFDTPLAYGSKIIEGKVVVPEIKAVEVPQPVQLTTEEIKKQKYNEINWQYQDKLRKLINTINILEAQGLSTDKVKAEYNAVMTSYKNALLAISNS